MPAWKSEYADQVISIGDFVLMGGDLPAMVFLEGLSAAYSRRGWQTRIS